MSVEPSANWREGQRWRERKSVDHTLRHGIRSMLRSVAQRDDFDVPDLATMANLSDDLEGALALAVANLRRQGHSWQAIANVLDITRQSAHERFSKRAGVR